MVDQEATISKMNDQIREMQQSICAKQKQLEEAVNKNSKNEVMRKLSKIFGKLYAYSAKVGTEIIEGAKKKMIKELIDWGVNYAPKLIENVSNLISG